MPITEMTAARPGGRNALIAQEAFAAEDDLLAVQPTDQALAGRLGHWAGWRQAEAPSLRRRQPQRRAAADGGIGSMAAMHGRPGVTVPAMSTPSPPPTAVFAIRTASRAATGRRRMPGASAPRTP